MQINLIHPGQPVADFAISGTSVTVAGHTIDCAARQQDVAIIIEIRDHNGTAIEGDQGAYLAQIQIPAKRYAALEVEELDEDEDGLQQEAPAAPVPEPLDTNAVLITLWPTV